MPRVPTFPDKAYIPDDMMFYAVHDGRDHRIPGALLKDQLGPIAGLEITLLGTVAGLDDLPSESNKGDAFFVAGVLYVFNGVAWINAGAVQGPPGTTTWAGLADKPATFETVSGQINDASEAGRALLTAADTETQRIALGVNSKAEATWAQSGAGAVSRGLHEKVQEASRSLLDFINPAHHSDIIARTGSTDHTAAIQSAFDSGENIYVPAGRYNLTDALTIANGRRLQGVSRSRSTFRVLSSFNMSALGVLRAGTSEPGANVSDIGLTFDQPDSPNRGDYIQYPPAIYVHNVPRTQLDRIRIEGAWDGIKATGNAGGAQWGFLEIGALNQGLHVDNSLAWIEIITIDLWPFGFTTPNRLAVHGDGETIGARFGRLDGLSVLNFLSFKCQVIFENTGFGITTGAISNMYMDYDGGEMVFNGGRVLISNFETIGTVVAQRPKIAQSAGWLWINNADIRGTSTHPLIKTTGTANFMMNGGLINQNDPDTPAVEAGGAMTRILNTELAVPGATSRTTGYLRQVSGALVALNCTGAVKAGGVTGNLVEVTTDFVRNHIANNDFGGWGMSLPANAKSGEYGPNKAPAIDFSTSLVAGFTTDNDLEPANVTRSAVLHRRGRHVSFRVLYQFDSNAYTTASGALRFGPFPVTPANTTPVHIGQMSKMTYDAAHLFTAELGTDGYIYMRRHASHSAVANVGTANLPASTTGFIFRFSGEFMV